MVSDELELDLPPCFEIGEKVKTRKLIRNDDTFPGQEIGATLAKKGEIGVSIIPCHLNSFAKRLQKRNEYLALRRTVASRLPTRRQTKEPSKDFMLDSNDEQLS